MIRVPVATLIATGLMCHAGCAAPLPQAEQQLIALVDGFAAQFASAPNKMAAGAVRHARAEALCGKAIGIQAAHGAIQNWIGAVDVLDSTSDGHGVLAVRLGDHVVVKTTNNTLSETMSDNKTLIPGNSPVFAAASALHIGATVRFSGTFFPSHDDCMFETSLTLDGSMSEPDFLFRFTSIQAAE